MVLVPQPGIKSVPPAQEVQSPGHMEHQGGPGVAAVEVFFFCNDHKVFHAPLFKKHISLLLDFSLGMWLALAKLILANTNRGLNTPCLL